MRLSAIVAMASNRVIGKDNALPWHLPADFKHFKSVTMGSPIVMGRKTYESIGRPLPGRRNVVISRDTSYSVEGCDVFHAPEAAIETLSGEEEVFIIGGATLYSLFLPQVQRLYLTVVQAEFDGDTRFPELDDARWREVAREDHKADDINKYDYSFVTLDRV